MAVDNKSDQIMLVSAQTLTINFNRGLGKRQELSIVNDGPNPITWTYYGLLRKNWQYVPDVIAGGPLVFIPGEIVPGSSYVELTNRGSQVLSALARTAGTFAPAPIVQSGGFLPPPADPQFNQTLGEWQTPVLSTPMATTLIGNYSYGFAIGMWVFQTSIVAGNAYLYSEQSPGNAHFLDFGYDRAAQNFTLYIVGNPPAINYTGGLDFGIVAPALTLNAWHHVLLNYLGLNGSPANGWEIYVDGVKKNPTTPAAALPFFVDTSLIQIGHPNWPNMMAPAVFPAALSAARISRDYNAVIYGSWSALIDTGVLAAGASTSRVYGEGSAQVLPEVMQLIFYANAGDAHGGYASRIVS